MSKEEIKKIKFKQSLKMEFEVMEISSIYERMKRGELKFDITKFHRQMFYLIVLVRSESTKHFIDFQSFEVEKGDLLLVGENQVHAFSSENRLDGKGIIFTSDFAEINELGRNSFKKLFNLHVINQLGNDPAVRELFNILANEYDSQTPNKTVFYKYLLGSLLSKVDLLVDEQGLIETSNEQTRIILDLDRLIEKFNYQIRDSARFAKELGYSYKQLNIICKTVTGETLKRYIDNTVILEMKRQIVANNMSLKELCVFFNFDEETNLVKYFKRNVGVSPKKFREKYHDFNG